MAEAIPFPTSSPNSDAQPTASKPASDVVTGVAVKAIEAVDKGAAAAQGVLDRGVGSAHSAIGRVADTAGPAIQRVQEGVQSAGASLKAKAQGVRDSAVDVTDHARSTIRDNPLTAVGAALAVGFVLARLTR